MAGPSASISRGSGRRAAGLREWHTGYQVRGMPAVGRGVHRIRWRPGRGRCLQEARTDRVEADPRELAEALGQKRHRRIERRLDRRHVPVVLAGHPCGRNRNRHHRGIWLQQPLQSIGHGHQHHDLNLRAAYLHVLADALTSVTAIVALTAGKFLGWSWLDPVMGIVGSAVVLVWAYGLVRDTSGILLDRTPESSDLPDEIRRAVESDGDSRITDLHVWQVGAGKFAAIVCIVAHDPKPVETYRQLFREHEELVHVTVEVLRCIEHEELRANA